MSEFSSFRPADAGQPKGSLSPDSAPPNTGSGDLAAMPQNTSTPERPEDSLILSTFTPESYQNELEKVRQMMSGSAAERDYSVTAMGALQSEIPHFIMEVAGGVEKGVKILEQTDDPEGTLVLLDRNIPSTAKIEAMATGDTVISKGFSRRVYHYVDRSFNDLPVAMALTNKFVDDLYEYIEAKKGAA
jgi:hypothetical protein